MDHEKRALTYAQGVSRMMQVDTVRRPGADESQFTQLHAVMESLFPHVYAGCQHWQFENSLLFRWKGKEARALVLMSHQDVVEATGTWRYPPFSGTIAEGKLWGRGAVDVKANLFSILQSVEELMAAGVTPAWDVYIATSHEEETGGNDLISNFLREQGVRVDVLVDEGTSIQPCPVPGVVGDFALVAVAEKGYLDIKCVACGRGGHASAPGKGTPLPRLGAFMCEVEATELFPTRLNSASSEMYRRLAALATGAEAERLSAIAEGRDGWQQKLDERQMDMLRTTVAFTMASGSGAANVIPQEAFVVCNIRIAPGETTEDVIATLRVVADRHGIKLEPLRNNQPSPVTDPKSDAFRRVEHAIQTAWPGQRTLPFLLAGGTDTKHFAALCPNCVRFTALKVSQTQHNSCHAVDENIDIDTLPNGVDFFKALIHGL